MAGFFLTKTKIPAGLAEKKELNRKNVKTKSV